jgi:hypothetical protein
MLLTRKITAAFVATFLVGALAGGFIQYDITDTKLSDFLKKTADPDSMTARIDKKYTDAYHLTPDQLTRIQPLTHDMALHVFQIRSQFGVDIVSSMNDFHHKVSEQLTPDQRALYDKDNLDRMARMNTMLVPNQSSPATPGK